MTVDHRTTAPMSSPVPDPDPARPPPTARRRLARASVPLALLVGACLAGGAVHAFDAAALTPAQTLIYETPHLAGTAAGDEIGYAWTERGGGDAGAGDALEDRATLEVVAAHEDGTRDVTLDFLSGERRIELPAFEGWRGNPVLMATLERFAQDFATAGGGGALYFRNRMRDALSTDAASAEPVERTWAGEPVAATRVEFHPFANDPYVGARPGFGDATVSLEFSDEVPGGVLSAAVESPERPDGADGPYRHELRLDDGAGR